MATTLAELVVKLSADSAALRKDMQQASKTMQEQSKKMTKVGKDLTMKVTLPLAAIGAASLKMASDAEEAANKFDVVMGDAADGVRARFEELHDTIPLTRHEMEGLAAGIQDLLVPMGVARGEAADMSATMVELAGDLASFNNIDPSQAIRAITSGLAGESEPLRRFGVDVRAARLEALALEEGLIGVGEELNSTARAQATLIAITRDSTDAIGDAARTVDSTANSIKFLWRDIKELSVTIGQILIPAVTPMIQQLSEVVGWLDDLDPATQRVIVGFAAIAAGAGPVLVALGAMTASVGALAAATGALVALSPAGWLVIGLGALAAALGTATAASSDFRDKFMEIADVLGRITSFDFVVEPVMGALGLEEETEATEELTDMQRSLIRAVAQRRGEQAQAAEFAKREAEAAAERARAEQQATQAVQQALAGVADELALIDAKASVFPGQFDAAALRVDALKDGVVALLEEGLEPSARVVQEMVERLEQAEFDRLMGLDLTRNQGRGTGGLADMNIPRLVGLDEMEAAAEAAGNRIEVLSLQYTDQEEAAASLVEQLSPVLHGFIALGSELGLIDGAAQRAVRGLSDVAIGIDNLSFEDGAFDLAGSLPGIAGIAGGVAGLIGGLFSDEDERAIEQARERFESVMDRYVGALADQTRWERLESEAVATAEQALDALADQILASVPDILKDEIGDIFAGLEDLSIEEQVAAIKGIGDAFGAALGPEAQSVLDAYLAHLEQIEKQREAEIAATEAAIHAEMFRVQGLDEAADALEREAARRKQLEKDLKLDPSGDLAALREELFEMQDAARAAAEAVEEHNRVFDESMKNLSLEAREAALAGDEVGEAVANANRARKEELKAAEEAFNSGKIGADTFQRWTDVIRDTFTEAVRDAEQAAKDAAIAQEEAARAEAFRTAQAKDNLRVEILRLQGMDEEARALARQIELLDAINDGRDAEYIALLEQKFAAEDAARAQQEAAEATRDFSREVNGLLRGLNQPKGFNIGGLRDTVLGGTPDFTQPLSGGGTTVIDQSTTINIGEIADRALPGESPGETVDRIIRENKRREQTGAGSIFDTGGGFY